MLTKSILLIKVLNMFLSVIFCRPPTTLLTPPPVCVCVCIWEIPPIVKWYIQLSSFPLQCTVSLYSCEPLPCCNLKPASLKSHKFLMHSPKPKILHTLSGFALFCPFSSLSFGWLTDDCFFCLCWFYLIKQNSGVYQTLCITPPDAAIFPPPALYLRRWKQCLLVTETWQIRGRLEEKPFIKKLELTTVFLQCRT